MASLTKLLYQDPDDDEWTDLTSDFDDEDLSFSHEKSKKKKGGKKKKKNLTKPSHYAIAKQLLQEVPIRRIRNVIYVYDSSLSLYVPATFPRIVKLLEQILPEQQIQKFNASDFKGGYELFLTKALSSENIQEIKIKPGYLLCRNGAFDIQTGERLEVSTDLVFLYKINAKYKKAKTPVFDEFLHTCSNGDPQVKQLILEFLAYSLLPDQDGKCFFVLGTAPNSGKSMIGKLLERFVGEDFVCHISLHNLKKTFSLSPIVGKALNLSMDLNSESLGSNEVSEIKQITGGDSFMIREKYQPDFPYRNTATWVFATNSAIYPRENDDAFFQRMVVVPLNKSIAKEDQDKDLLEALWQERNGILFKIMKAGKRLIENNYIFSECEQARWMKLSWQYHTIFSVISFVKNCCDFDDSEAEITTKQLYERYQEYCFENEFNVKSIKEFSKILHEQLHFERKRWADARGFLGIRLLEREDE